MGSVFALAGADTAVDFGTFRTRVHLRGRGVVVDQPSVAALCRADGRVIAFGDAAQRMIGRVSDGIEVVRPLRYGVIADLDLAGRMLRGFLRSGHGNRPLSRPQVAVAVPSEISQVEQRALEAAVYHAGARRVYIVEQGLAAALGCELDMAEPVADMVIDVGGGSTDVALVSLAGVVMARSIRVGGDALDQTIVALLRDEEDLLIGDRLAETIKIEIGSAFPGCAPGDRAPVYGRELSGGLPRMVYLSAESVRLALAEPLSAIVTAVLALLNDCPPEVAGDLVDRGILLTGGGSQLPGLDLLLHKETGLPIRRVDDPCRSVVNGLAKWLADRDPLEEPQPVATSALSTANSTRWPRPSA